MSNISNDRLQEVIDGDILFTDEQRNLARELLALREAGKEPVADIVEWLHPSEERTCDVRLRRFDLNPGPLYLHPQHGKAVKVPEQVPKSLKDKLLTICDLVEDNDEYCQDIWNACRAAMLKEAQQ
ncbi:hypothetical protein [Dryocola sp. BD613]|uniref:hypothetical protein n=1 Tax=Dryocola sp. BD613 TaxID=3133272 RepID=UPI003F5041E7